MKNIAALLIILALAGTLSANNISISNLVLTGKNTGSHYTMVQFDISWENSWRTSTNESNWDAAWIFVKFRVAGGTWQHSWLNDDGHTAPAGSTISPGFLTPGAAFNSTTNPGLGVFIYRSAIGAGTFTKTGVQLRWNYGANSLGDGDIVEVKVFAIEMVYVPQGAFAVGSGGTESGSFTNGSWTSGATIPLSISSESALTIAHTAGNLWGTSVSGDNTIGGAGTLPAVFPKGYGAFYCMKYEMSQQQYVDFLNTLTSTQATNRYSSGSTGYRYGISVSGGVYSTSNPYVACNFLSWMDGAAYTDWAGLRPMTELEFEKACRGTATPVAGENAWGNTTATAAINITNGGANNETTNTSGANAVFYNLVNALQGPMRTCVFANG
ncbi:MAG: SUMF1/EgtB/PvdO family nonheme iron enzyme, partial [Bacteroidota bacterium]